MQFGKIWQGRVASLSGQPLSASNNNDGLPGSSTLSRRSAANFACSGTDGQLIELRPFTAGRLRPVQFWFGK